MKRILALLLCVITLLALVGCNGDADSKTDNSVNLDIEAEADSIIQKYEISGGTRYSSTATELGKYLDEDLIRSYYGDAASVPDFGNVEAYAVYIDESKPLDPCEFGIFKLKDASKADEFMLYLKARIDLKIENARAYPTMDTEALETAKFAKKDNYVWYCAVKGGNDEINKNLEGKFN
jgi:hypothetical protein